MSAFKIKINTLLNDWLNNHIWKRLDEREFSFIIQITSPITFSKQNKIQHTEHPMKGSIGFQSNSFSIPFNSHHPTSLIPIYLYLSISMENKNRSFQRSRFVRKLAKKYSHGFRSCVPCSSGRCSVRSRQEG